ncbi:BnaC05g18860D [Brassica napus]|uniref:Carbonic anhydrase n=1 Tax=Brassica napus TaxID=3708 RepID=A0A078I9L7_BRANA|nr:BnaC05g18860D [Brassica napus]
MSTETYEDALKKLGGLLSKKSDLGKVAASMIKKLTVELEELDSNKSSDAVERIKSGFIHFKTHKYLKKPSLPKFLVFACSDSRVSPTQILNFKPGEAFVVRNIANMVPPFDKTQHSGVGAALEFPVIALNVENILVIDDAAPSKNVFIDNWIQIGTPAKNMVKQDFKHLSFNDQCSYCEKEAVNVSLGNLLSYPFVKERVVKNKLALRGAHYDFVKGTFDLWELDFKTTPAFSFS